MARDNIGFPLAVGQGGALYQSGPGVEQPALNAFRVTPLASNATNVAVVQTINATTFALAAGTGTTQTTGPGGVSIILFDTPRTVAMSGVANAAATRCTIVGFDRVGGAMAPMTEVMSSPASANKTYGVKAFYAIQSITATSNTAQNVAIGTSDVLGLNEKLTALSDVVAINWANTLQTATTGLTVASTVTATASTGDVRGTYALQTAADGVRSLNLVYVVTDPDTTAGIYGVTQA